MNKITYIAIIFLALMPFASSANEITYKTYDLPDVTINTKYGRHPIRDTDIPSISTKGEFVLTYSDMYGTVYHYLVYSSDGHLKSHKVSSENKRIFGINNNDSLIYTIPSKDPTANDTYIIRSNGLEYKIEQGDGFNNYKLKNNEYVSIWGIDDQDRLIAEIDGSRSSFAAVIQDKNLYKAYKTSQSSIPLGVNSSGVIVGSTGGTGPGGLFSTVWFSNAGKIIRKVKAKGQVTNLLDIGGFGTLLSENGYAVVPTDDNSGHGNGADDKKTFCTISPNSKKCIALSSSETTDYYYFPQSISDDGTVFGYYRAKTTSEKGSFFYRNLTLTKYKDPSKVENCRCWTSSTGLNETPPLDGVYYFGMSSTGTIYGIESKFGLRKLLIGTFSD